MQELKVRYPVASTSLVVEPNAASQESQMSGCQHRLLHLWLLELQMQTTKTIKTTRCIKNRTPYFSP